MNKRLLKHYRFGKTFAQINRSVRSRRKAIEKIRKLYKNSDLVHKGCNLCGGGIFTLVSEGDRYGFDLSKQFCNQCGLIQTYPALSKKFHKEFYGHYYRPLYLKSSKVDYQSLINEQSVKGEKYLDYFMSNGLKDVLGEISVIEIGCSSGGTLRTLRPYVKSVRGCDLDIEAIAFSKKTFDLNVEVASLPSTLPDGKKLFIMSHVLEHVCDPLETLKKLRSLMGEGDYLFLAVPGINMVAKGDYKHDLRRYFHIAHVTDFTASTLIAMTGYAGFKMLVVDEEIKGLFEPGKVVAWPKCNDKLIAENIQRIEKTYHGHFPHL